MEGTSDSVGWVRWPLIFFSKEVYEFLVESNSDFTKEAPLREYDNRKENWPKCMHGEDCLVHMRAEGMDGGRCFIKCLRAWVILSTNGVLNMFHTYCMIYTRFFCFRHPILQRTAGS